MPQTSTTQVQTNALNGAGTNDACEEEDGEEAYSSCNSLLYDPTQNDDDCSDDEIADNNCDPFITLVIPDDDIHLQELVEDREINLSVCNSINNRCIPE
jgi:hypothetical protein